MIHVPAAVIQHARDHTIAELSLCNAWPQDTEVGPVNATGYGLTFGIHSRIDDRIADVTGRIKAGNFYVNRNQIGAIVGSQPFGGNGLSGTGPKTGGPAYVPRYTRAAQGEGIEGAPESLADLPPFDAVIYWGNPTNARAYSQALASRPGPILPPITETGPTPRLIVERHTCIDTRAVGGNVALLASRRVGCSSASPKPRRHLLRRRGAFSEKTRLLFHRRIPSRQETLAVQSIQIHHQCRSQPDRPKR
jgi:hypothetical protein